jgi:hypothetical protein
MTRSKGDDLPAGGTGKLTPGRGSRRLWPAIDARRRLNARPASGIPAQADPPDRNDPPSSPPTSRRRAKSSPTVVERAHHEGDFHREIVRRAKRVRERAAQSLRRSRRAEEPTEP